MATQPEVVAGQQAPPEPKPKQEALSVVDNRPAEVQLFEYQQRAAKLFAASGLFADIKGQTETQAIAQSFVKISLGHSMGFTPAESMTGIDLIQGRVAVGSNLRAARMQRGGYSWDILQLDDRGCRLRLKYKGEYLMCEEIDGKTGETRQVPVIVAFMVEDAVRAGLIGKDNYKKNPRNMFFARAITNAQRWYAPGILGVDILDTTEAQDMPPLIDAEQAKSERVKNGTDAKADRILEKYTTRPRETVEQELGVTDRDIQQVSQDGPTVQTSETPSASSQVEEVAQSGAGPQRPLEPGSTPTPAAQEQSQVSTTPEKPTGDKPLGVPLDFGNDSRRGQRRHRDLG